MSKATDVSRVVTTIYQLRLRSSLSTAVIYSITSVDLRPVERAEMMGGFMWR